MLTIGSLPKAEKAKGFETLVCIGHESAKAQAFKNSADALKGPKVMAFTFPFGKLWKKKARKVYEAGSIVADVKGKVYLTAYGGVNLLAWVAYVVYRVQGAGKEKAIAMVKETHATVGALANWDVRELEKCVKGGAK